MVPLIMKTTVEIADDLLRRAKALATARNTTLRAVIEQGLRQVLRKEGTPTDFTLQDASVDGHGLKDEFRDMDWAAMREAAYEDRGG